MPPRPFILANALAAVLAAVLYGVALFVFAVFDSSDFGRINRAGLQLELIYFAAYFLYFALYLAFAVALTREGTSPLRVALGLVAALSVPLLGVAAFYLGYLAGALLFLIPGWLLVSPVPTGWGGALALSLIAIPATGLTVGWAFNAILRLLAGWQKADAAVARIRRANLAVATVCACIAAYLAVIHGMGAPPPLGLGRVIETMIVGLAGPALHVTAALSMAFKPRAGETRGPLGAQAAIAAAILIAIALVPLGAAGWITHVRSDHRLWTAQGLARVFVTPEAVRQRRQPPADAPIRIAGYFVDRRPADLKESSYDWQTEQFLHAMFKLGDADAPDHRIEVTLDLTKSYQHGLGYLCDEPVEGTLTPCRVADFNKDLKDDPRIIRVGLYQGESAIGRVGRTFLISCRYSFGICKLEFVEPWYEGLRVALIFPQKERDHWPEIVRFALPEIERVVRRVP